MPGKSWLDDVSDRMLLFGFRVRVTMEDSTEKGHRKLCLDQEVAVRWKGRYYYM